MAAAHLTDDELTLIKGAEAALQRSLQELVDKHIAGHQRDLAGAGLRFTGKDGGAVVYRLTVQVAGTDRKASVSGTVGVHLTRYLVPPTFQEITND